MALRGAAEDRGREIIAPGAENIWICELGRAEVNGTFEQFIEGILSAKLTFERLHARYHSPSQGELEFGWQGDLLQNGVVVKLDGYPRYENPFVKAAFGVEEVEWERGEAPGI